MYCELTVIFYGRYSFDNFENIGLRSIHNATTSHHIEQLLLCSDNKLNPIYNYNYPTIVYNLNENNWQIGNESDSRQPMGLPMG